MAEVRVRTTGTTFWFYCEGCGVAIGHEDLWQLHYESHDRCYTDRPDLVRAARDSGVGDIYTYMAESIRVRGNVRYDLWVAGAMLLQNPPPG